MNTYWDTNSYCQDGCNQKENFHLTQKYPRRQQRHQMLNSEEPVVVHIILIIAL